MDSQEEFELRKAANIRELGEDRSLVQMSREWMLKSSQHSYTYNFTWLGRPIIQFPQDLIAVQEIIWNVRPRVVIETGVAHGGGAIFYASLLELIGEGIVIAIDVDLREHNRMEIERHPLSKRIVLVDGSSTDPAIRDRVYSLVGDQKQVVLLLDSDHTHDHVLRELELYSPLVNAGGYIVVFDTSIEDAPEGFFEGRRWGKGNNPKTAVREFLGKSDRFVVDKTIEDKLLITVAPEGYLKCIKD